MEKSHIDVTEHQISHCHSGADTGDSDPNIVSLYNRRSNVSCCSSEIVGISDKRKDSSSCGSDCSVENLDLESGIREMKNNAVHFDEKVEKDCRICHLSLDLTNQESGYPIELGCCCKDDLAAAHKHCAEAWFKIKGNKTCEICGSIARNVAGASEAELVGQWNGANVAIITTAPPATTLPSETRNSWLGRRFLNFLLACMVLAFVISWLFHFDVR